MMDVEHASRAGNHSKPEPGPAGGKPVDKVAMKSFALLAIRCSQQRQSFEVEADA